MGITVLSDIALHPTYDPYDLWATPLGVMTKKHFYEGKALGKVAAVSLGGMDWIFPNLVRVLFHCKPRFYPIVVAQEILRRSYQAQVNPENAVIFLELLKSVAVDPSGVKGWAWGVGFPWMSKNGLYEPTVPFVTHTPYVMEALIALSDMSNVKEEALTMLQGTWGFIESLLKMYDGSDGLALSYAPVEEPRIVVNANAYAAYACGLHITHGYVAIQEHAKKMSLRLVQWVIRQQQVNGSWSYYADDQPGNFIDCFHTCFVLKNLLKTSRLIPEVRDFITPFVQKGWSYLRENFFDDSAGLCRRFAVRDIKDPFVWDLYDQAEYLGLLIDFGLYKEAKSFSKHVKKQFQKKDDWYCRIDILGRCWGKNFLRWGVMPFFYNTSLLCRKKNYQQNIR